MIRMTRIIHQNLQSLLLLHFQKIKKKKEKDKGKGKDS